MLQSFRGSRFTSQRRLRVVAVEQDLVGRMCCTSGQDRHREQQRPKESYRVARIQAEEEIYRVVGTREYLINAG